MTDCIKTEDHPSYITPKERAEKTIAANEDRAIIAAINLLRNRLRQPGAFLESPHVANTFLRLELAEEFEEVFAVLYLDNKHRLIEFEKLFRGTIDGVSVPPRVVARRALETGAAAVMFAHNHPSGIATPSDADKRITERLVDALRLFDVRVLDHIIIGGDADLEFISFAEEGLI